MKFAEKVIRFYEDLSPRLTLPDGVGVLNPYLNSECMDACRRFYSKYYNDENTRHLILGINPGRYGAGITGIPFTDPIKLEQVFDVPNTLPKKPELSAEFIHSMIGAFGGYEKFFSSFFINSVSPLGFVKQGKNLNYYDSPALKESLMPFIRKSMIALLDLGIHRDMVFVLGEGENFKFVRQLNNREGWFDEIIPLAHPRFVLQYRRKRVSLYIDDYVAKLNRAVAR